MREWARRAITGLLGACCVVARLSWARRRLLGRDNRM